jgi:hypothetical protein
VLRDPRQPRPTLALAILVAHLPDLALSRIDLGDGLRCGPADRLEGFRFGNEETGFGTTLRDGPAVDPASRLEPTDLLLGEWADVDAEAVANVDRGRRVVLQELCPSGKRHDLGLRLHDPPGDAAEGDDQAREVMREFGPRDTLGVARVGATDLPVGGRFDREGPAGREGGGVGHEVLLKGRLYNPAPPARLRRW